MIKQNLILIIAIAISNGIFAQKVIAGKVIDSDTKKGIPYVHIGVKSKDYGTISRVNGNFYLNIPENKENDAIYFSSIGYEDQIIPIRKLFKEGKIIELDQKTYKLLEVVISSDKKRPKHSKIGGFRKSVFSTGESNTDEYGVGKEYAVKIKYPGYNYKVKKINFDLKFNTIDSVLFRINFYSISKKGVPDKSLLKSQIFVKTYKGEHLITANVSEHNIYIDQDLVVSIEPVHLWYDKKNDNQLFYRQCKGYQEESFLRSSSISSWETNVLPPFMIYLETEYYK